MKYITQFCIILFLSFLGEVLHALIPLPVPAGIYGILILLTALERKWIPVCAVDKTGKFLIEIMPVMFIPAAAGLLDSWEIMKPAFVPYLAITVISTVAVMAAAGRTTQRLLQKKTAGKKKTEEKE